MAADTTVDLITLVEYQNYAAKDQDDKNVNQEHHEFLITAASKAFTQLVGRGLLRAEHIFDFQGHNGLVQYLPRTPVNGVTSIEYWDVTAWTTASTGTYPRQLEPSTDSTHVRMTDDVFRKGIRWRITYTGGYLLAAIPMDIKECVCQMVQRSMARALGKEGVTSESMNDQSISLDLKMLASNKIQQIANRYMTIVNL